MSNTWASSLRQKSTSWSNFLLSKPRKSFVNRQSRKILILLSTHSLKDIISLSRVLGEPCDTKLLIQHFGKHQQQMSDISSGGPNAFTFILVKCKDYRSLLLTISRWLQVFILSWLWLWLGSILSSKKENGEKVIWILNSHRIPYWSEIGRNLSCQQAILILFCKIFCLYINSASDKKYPLNLLSEDCAK